MVELKKRILQRIQQTTNPDVLAEVYRLLDTDLDDSEVHQFSEKQISAINEADNQITKGQFLTNEEAGKEAEEWLKSK